MNAGYLPYVRIYQYISEAILFYFLIVPIYYFMGRPLPFISYVGTILVTVILLGIVARFTTSYLPYLFYVPLTTIVLDRLVGYPIFVAIFIAAFLGWRFVKHQQEEGFDNEFTILVFTIVIAIVESLVISDPYFFVMVVLQVIVLVFGHLLSHIVSVSSHSNGKPYKYTAVLLSVFVAITAGFLWVYEGLTMLFVGIIYVFSRILLGVLQGISYVFSLTGLSGMMEGVFPDNLSDKMKDAQEQMQQGSEKKLDTPPYEGSEAVTNGMYWGALIVVLIIGVAIALYYIGKKMKVMNAEGNNNVISTKWLGKREEGTKKSFTGFFRRKPDHPIRQLFFDFERFAQKKGFGRKNYETIEDWFERLGVPEANVEIYQKVRYGEVELSEEEVAKFKQDLKQLRVALIEQAE